MVNGRIDCETMDLWNDEGGSAASFKANDSPTHEELLWRNEDDFEIGEVRQASWPSDLHEDFWDYEIQPDKFVEFFRTNGARLRIQYWAVVGTHFESGSSTEGEYHLRIVSGGFRDWGRGYAKGAFEENLPNDAVIVARYVTLRFVGQLV